MFWSRKQSKGDPYIAPPARYELHDETDDYALYAYRPGIPVSIRDLQDMRGQGWRAIFVEDVRSSEMMHCVICERIKS